MARPGYKDVQAGLENWDAAIRDNFNNFAARPSPLFNISAGTLNLWPASGYAQCFASYETSPGVWRPVWSNGTNWFDLINGTQY